MKNNPRNSAYMKFANRQQILNIIRKGPVSRAELARRTGLTRAAVTLIMDELVREGIVLETGTGTADYGRKPVLLEINPCCRYAVGLDISRGGCSAGVVNIKGEPVLKREINIGSASNAAEALDIISGELKLLIEDSNIDTDKLLGMGVSSPGPLDVHSGIILNPPNFGMWHGVNIVEELKKHFPFCVYLENNSTALALAEKNYDKGHALGSFMLLVVNTGIGAGIVIDDRLYRGVGGFGSEVGHTTIDINGERCDCGNRGCLELYASIPAVLKRVYPYNRDISSWSDIVDRAEDGDEFCREVVEMEARYLSAGIINVVNLLELEGIILTGFINYKPRMLLDRIRDIVGSTTITRNIHKLSICASSITTDAEVISAAAIAVDRFFCSQW